MHDTCTWQCMCKMMFISTVNKCCAEWFPVVIEEYVQNDV